MLNANVYNLVGVFLCICVCAGILIFLCREYEFSLGDDDEGGV